MEHEADKFYGDYVLCTCGDRIVTYDFKIHCLRKNEPSKMMECTTCNKTKHVNEFATPDVCNDCVKI